jgi:hypothetical protein
VTSDVEVRAVRYATRVGRVGVAVGLAVTAPLWAAIWGDLGHRVTLHAICLLVLVALSLQVLARGSARAILRRQGRGGAWTGPLSALATLMAAATGVVAANLVLAVPESVRRGGLQGALDAYVFKPYVMFLVAGCVPALIVGLVCGWRMRVRIARMLREA